MKKFFKFFYKLNTSLKNPLFFLNFELYSDLTNYVYT